MREGERERERERKSEREREGGGEGGTLISFNTNFIHISMVCIQSILIRYSFKCSYYVIRVGTV